MSKGSYFICGYYFGLPEFPNICKIVTNNLLLLRDVLCCFQNNSHIYWGGQYDPHYEYEESPQFKKCNLIFRNKIRKLAYSEKYDNIYLLFRTNRQFLNKTNKKYVSGYYEINQKNIEIDKDYDDPVLYAKKVVFLDLADSIDITEFLKGKNYDRFGFSSETDGGKYHTFLSKIKDDMDKKINKFDLYKEETKKTDNIFKYYEYEPGIYKICEGCPALGTCSLIKRIKNKGKLYNKLPSEIADIINEYYKTNIKL